jgi:hypothetical protein
MAGVKQVFTCPKNRAVDKAMNDCLKAHPKIRAIRYVTGFRGEAVVKKATSASASDTANANVSFGEEQKLDEAWELYLGLCDLRQTAHPNHLYNKVKIDAITTWASNAAHGLHDKTVEYLEKRKTVDQIKDSKERSATRGHLSVLDATLTSYFFKECVDLVFVTCSSACHDDLKSFDARIAYVDEAGQAALPDLCIVAGAFQKSLRAFHQTGDFKQLGPTVVAEEANEAFNMIKASHFENLIGDPNKRWEYSMLSVQYRSCPDITVYPNEAFYNSQLVNHESTMTIKPVQKTMGQFLATLGKVWNKKWSIAIDVSTGDTASAKYGNTSSFYNEAEAEIVVKLICAMLAFTPVDDGLASKPVPIKPGHIGIFTPYKGQVRAIGAKLRVCGIKTSRSASNPEDSIQFLGTTHSIQGGDVDIGFISGIIRDPKNADNHIKFTGDKKNVAVNTTRSRWTQFYIGNFGPMVEFLQTSDTIKLHASKIHRMPEFKALVRGYHDTDSIISSEDIYEALLDKKRTLLKASRWHKAFPMKFPESDRMQKNASKGGKNLPLKQVKADGKPSSGAPGDGLGNRKKRPQPTTSKPEPNKRSKVPGGQKKKKDVETQKNEVNEVSDRPNTPVEETLIDDLADLIVTGKKQTKRQQFKDDAKKAGMSVTAYKKHVKESKKDKGSNEISQKQTM